MSEPLFVVIDQGSTATKGAVVSARGERLEEMSLPVRRRHEGARVEHDPAEIVQGVRDLLQELRKGRDVAAVGLTCQRSTCLVWDRQTGRPLTTALSWQDRSCQKTVARLADAREEVARRTGLQLNPHYAAPKLAHLISSLPRGLERARSGELVAGTLDAFLVRSLTGVDATEPGHAGRSLLFNLEEGAWDPWLCDLFGIPEQALPALNTSTGKWGDVDGVPLTAVAGDQQAALVGHGGWRRGIAAAHFGTGAFILASTGGVTVRHPGLLTAVLASTPRERRFQIEGTVNSAGSAVDWACGISGVRIEDFGDRELEPERLPLVLPAFAGLAAPWWRASARAVVANLSQETSGEDLLAGVLAGVAMRVIDNVEALRDAGARTRTLRVSGKLTRLRGFVRLLADAGQVPVEISPEEETGLAGIARLAAAGLSGQTAELMTSPPASLRIEPRWSRGEAGRARGRWLGFVEANLAGVGDR